LAFVVQTLNVFMDPLFDDLDVRWLADAAEEFH
jgi:hypothetical protein